MAIIIFYTIPIRWKSGDFRFLKSHRLHSIMWFLSFLILYPSGSKRLQHSTNIHIQCIRMYILILLFFFPTYRRISIFSLHTLCVKVSTGSASQRLMFQRNTEICIWIFRLMVVFLYCSSRRWWAGKQLKIDLYFFFSACCRSMFDFQLLHLRTQLDWNIHILDWICHINIWVHFQQKRGFMPSKLKWQKVNAYFENVS